MQAQEYTVKEWKPWIDNNTRTAVTDNFGNVKGSVIFEEFASEPVDAAFKVDPEVGDKKYGEIQEYKTQKGLDRLRFKSHSRPQEGFGGQPTAPVQPPSQPASHTKTEWQPKDNDAIRAQWAIGQAFSKVENSGLNSEEWNRVELNAKALYAMVDRVKSQPGTTEQGLKVNTSVEQDVAEQQAKRDAQSLRSKKDSVWNPSDAELESLEQSIIDSNFDDEEVDLSQIPS